MHRNIRNWSQRVLVIFHEHFPQQKYGNDRILILLTSNTASIITHKNTSNISSSLEIIYAFGKDNSRAAQQSKQQPKTFDWYSAVNIPYIYLRTFIQKHQASFHVTVNKPVNIQQRAEMMFVMISECDIGTGSFI